MTNRSIFLFKTEGSSDKVYNLHLRAKDSGWVVDYENARRGKALRSGTKTKEPLAFEEAEALYERTVNSKIKDGYTEEESGAVFAGTELAGDVTGFKPQLLNEVTQDDLLGLIETGEWVIQEKHDGERRGSRLSGSEYVYSNRTGLRVGVQQTIQDGLEKISKSGLSSFDFDGEDMGDHLVVFDLISFDGEDLTQMRFEDRAKKLHLLDQLTKRLGIENTIRVDVPREPQSREEMLSILASDRKAGKEGVVLRRKDAPITAGRPSSGGTALKHKFWESATTRVKQCSKTKRSIAIEILDGENWVGVGNCTIPSNHEIPSKGTLVEIEYLYAYQGGSLYQPKYRGVRSDIPEENVVIGQLKFFKPKK